LRPEGEPRRLTATPAGVINGLAWTRDGAAVVYSVGLTLGRSYLWRLDIGGAPPQRIEVAGRGAAFPAIARTKDHMVFAHALFDLDIYRFEPGVRGSTVHISSSFEDASPSFSPDGRRIAYDSGRSGHNEEIWLADADGSNPVQLTRGPNQWQGTPRWSPDGRQIVFDSWSADRLSDVWTIDVDGGPPRRLTSGPLAESQAIWSRDGRWIYYSHTDADGRRDVWRMPAGGGAAERITEHGGIIARESPDGRTLFFTPRERTSPLMSRPVAGGPERQVVDCVLTRSLADGPDGMYYLGCPLEAREVPLFRLDPATGRSHLLGHLETGGVPVYGLAVSPDGRSVLYTRIVAQGADLMLIEGFR
jgi:Tol biopolymer transport system component